MCKKHINNLLHFCRNLYENLERMNTIIVITRNYYENKEMHGQYYNLPEECTIHISRERSHCINMLSLLFDEIIVLKRGFETIEDELHDNADNRS